MSSKSIIITGFVASFLLIVICIMLNAQRYYKELGLETRVDSSSLISKTTILKDHKVEAENVTVNNVSIPIKESKKALVMTNQNIEIPSEPTLSMPKEVQVQEEITNLLKSRQITFKKNSGYLTSESQQVLDKIVAMVKSNDTLQLSEEGHTDAGGKDKVNQSISQMRANKVKEYLVAKGFNSQSISAQGFGESQLLLPNDPNNILNRRVEIHVTRR